MKKLLPLVLSILLFVGCSTRPVERGYAVIETVTTTFSMDKYYTVWTGLLDMGSPVGGIIVKRKPIDLRIGDIVVIERHPGDALWTATKRVNENR